MPILLDSDVIAVNFKKNVLNEYLLKKWISSLLQIVKNGQEQSYLTCPFGGKLAIFKHVGNGQNLRLELISVHQTIKGDPNNGLDELELNRTYLSHFST